MSRSEADLQATSIPRATTSTSRHSRNALTLKSLNTAGDSSSCKIACSRFKSAKEVDDPYSCLVDAALAPKSESDSHDEPEPEEENPRCCGGRRRRRGSRRRESDREADEPAQVEGGPDADSDRGPSLR